jgi:hypothetical protein
MRRAATVDPARIIHDPMRMLLAAALALAATAAQAAENLKSAN